MNKRGKLTILGILVLMSLLVAWKGVLDFQAELKASGQSLDDYLWQASVTNSGSQPVVDREALYTDTAADTKVLPLFVVVLPASSPNANSATFQELNQFSSYQEDKPVLDAYVLDSYPPDVQTAQALLEQKLAQGVSLADLVPNARITLRGHSTMLAKRKSYKVTLNTDAVTWQGQTKINLNKHPFDPSRMRNKIAFDLFRQIPGLTSMVTHYVHVQILDLSAASLGEPVGDADLHFVDYGLFTQIENADKSFLKNHGLDENGNLYKVNSFEYLRYPQQILDVDDPAYDEAAFEERLEICSGQSHAKLIQMIEDVNNLDYDIDDVLNRNFNRDNYMTWLATNILLGNYDTQNQNYFLYSPHDQLTWYFLPWDYDGSLYASSWYMRDDQGQLVQFIGIANYWGNVLHRRVFSEVHHVEELSRKIDSAYKILTSGLMEEEIQKYQPIVEQFNLHRTDDDQFTDEKFYASLDNIRTAVAINYQLYYDTLEKPMPVFLGNIEPVAEGTEFFWTESYDLQGDRFSYQLQISRDLLFKDIVFEKSRLAVNHFIVDLDPGTYYWKITVKDSKNNTQRAFDLYYDQSDKNHRYYGLRKIEIEP